MIKWDLNTWKAKHEMKTSLQIYCIPKNDIGEEKIHNNRPSSTIVNKNTTAE